MKMSALSWVFPSRGVLVVQAEFLLLLSPFCNFRSCFSGLEMLNSFTVGKVGLSWSLLLPFRAPLVPPHIFSWCVCVTGRENARIGN